jgi:lipoate-protein ligase B
MREPGGHTLLFADLSRMDYSEALSLQHDIVSALKSGWIRQGIVLLLEHFPVYTVGRGRDLKNLNVSRRFLRRIGIPVISVERGGDITYHGPGQIVVYPILDLKHLGLGVHQYIALLEQVMVSTAAEWGIAAKGGTEKRGVWCDDRKLGSLGISVSRGISFHGMALNVNVSLTPFQWIHPCGLQDVRSRRCSGNAAIRCRCTGFERSCSSISRICWPENRAGSSRMPWQRGSGQHPAEKTGVFMINSSLQIRSYR